MICQALEAQGLKESELLAKLEKKIAALKEKAIEDELSEAQKQKETKVKDMLLKILLENGFN